MPNQGKEKLEWWVFFPFMGLDIEDEEHDLNSPMFGDATIVSKRHLEGIFEPVRSKEGVNPQVIQHMIQIIKEHEEGKAPRFHSYLAVLRCGVPDENKKRQDYVESAYQRARHISSLLSLSRAAAEQDGDTCGLASQSMTLRSTVAVLSRDLQKLTHQHFSHESFTEKYAWPFRREYLLSVLKTGYFKHLADVLMPPKSNLPKSVAHTIALAAVRLAESLHTPTFSSHLLGAITCIEILLSVSDFEQLKRSIMALLGPEGYERLKVEECLKSRHAYVHRAVEPGREHAVYAVALAINCLVQVSELAKTLEDKVNIINYLEMIYYHERVIDYYNTDEISKFHSLLKHKRQINVYDFISWRLNGA